MKKIIVILFFLVLSNNVFSQKTKTPEYYLYQIDTVHTIDTVYVASEKEITIKINGFAIIALMGFIFLFFYAVISQKKERQNE